MKILTLQFLILASIGLSCKQRETSTQAGAFVGLEKVTDQDLSNQFYGEKSLQHLFLLLGVEHDPSTDTQKSLLIATKNKGPENTRFLYLDLNDPRASKTSAHYKKYAHQNGTVYHYVASLDGGALTWNVGKRYDGGMTEADLDGLLTYTHEPSTKPANKEEALVNLNGPAFNQYFKSQATPMVVHFYEKAPGRVIYQFASKSKGRYLVGTINLSLDDSTAVHFKNQLSGRAMPFTAVYAPGTELSAIGYSGSILSSTHMEKLESQIERALSMKDQSLAKAPIKEMTEGMTLASLKTEMQLNQQVILVLHAAGESSTGPYKKERVASKKLLKDLENRTKGTNVAVISCDIGYACIEDFANFLPKEGHPDLPFVVKARAESNDWYVLGKHGGASIDDLQIEVSNR